ncbi:MAG TPA: hypothetical protein VIQ76_03825, partial [Propionibacteriaceae bacterium]
RQAHRPPPHRRPSQGRRHRAPRSGARKWFMIDRWTIRLSAVLLVVGFILYMVVDLLHPDGPGPFESEASHRAPIDDPNGRTARSIG